MATRRAFLQTAALGLAGSAFAQPASSASLVDFHAHWIGPGVVELLGQRTSPRPPQGQGWFDIEARLRQMDQNNVQRQVLSYVGAAYDGVLAPDEARPLWRAQNDDLAALVKKYPSRFPGLATLPTANLAWAAEELQRAHQELGLIGATLPLDAFISLAGAKMLAPVFAVAQKHRSHIFVHRGGRERRHPRPPSRSRRHQSLLRTRQPGSCQPGDGCHTGRQPAGSPTADNSYPPRHRGDHARAHGFSRRLP